MKTYATGPAGTRLSEEGIWRVFLRGTERERMGTWSFHICSAQALEPGLDAVPDCHLSPWELSRHLAS